MNAFALEARMGSVVAAEIYLNGALLSDKQPGQMASQSLAIQHEVLPGRNQILAIVTAGGIPPQAAPRLAPDVDPADCFVELYLDRETVKDLGDRYQVTNDPLDERRWRPAEEGGPLSLPHRIVLEFEAPGLFLPPVWTRATAVQPEAVRGQVAAALEDLRRLLEARDFPAFQVRMRLRNEDMARAYPLSGSAAERAVRDSSTLAEEMGAPGAKIPPVDPSGLVIRTFADGRIIDPRAGDGHPALRIVAPGADPVFLSVSFSLIEGRLSPVR